MKLEVYRDFHGAWELAGTFISTRDEVRFFYDVRYVQRG